MSRGRPGTNTRLSSSTSTCAAVPSAPAIQPERNVVAMVCIVSARWLLRGGLGGFVTTRKNLQDACLDLKRIGLMDAP